MEFGSDEEFEKRGLADPDASKDDPENEATKETMKKGAAKVVGREQTTKTLGAGKGGKVGEVEELGANPAVLLGPPRRAQERVRNPEGGDEGLRIRYHPDWMLVIHEETGECSRVRMVTGCQGNP